MKRVRALPAYLDPATFLRISQSQDRTWERSQGAWGSSLQLVAGLKLQSAWYCNKLDFFGLPTATVGACVTTGMCHGRDERPLRSSDQD